MKQRETFNYFKNKTPGAEGFGKGMAINHQIRWQESSRSFIFNALEEQAQSTGSTESHSTQQWQKAALFSSDWGDCRSQRHSGLFSFKSFGSDPHRCNGSLRDGANFARLAFFISTISRATKGSRKLGLGVFGWGFQWGRTPALLLDEAGISHSPHRQTGFVGLAHPQDRPPNFTLTNTTTVPLCSCSPLVIHLLNLYNISFSFPFLTENREQDADARINGILCAY